MNLIKTFEFLSAMSDVRRYSMVRLSEPENVLEHTAFVTIISYFMALEVNHHLIDDHKLNLSKVLSRALVHDIEEIVTGDIPRPTKYHSVAIRDLIRNIEDQGMDRKLKELELSSLVCQQIQAGRELSKSGREGLIVAIADTLAVVYKSWDEVLLRGNLSMVKVAASTIPDIEQLATKVDKTFFSDEERGAAHFLFSILDHAKVIVTKSQEKI